MLAHAEGAPRWKSSFGCISAAFLRQDSIEAKLFLALVLLRATKEWATAYLPMHGFYMIRCYPGHDDI